MCDACEHETGCKIKAEKRLRRKLWEVNPRFHCAILGTCLTVDDLHKITRQSGLSLKDDCADYELHATLVAQADRRSKVNRHIQKMLERKYRRWVQTAALLRQSEALEKFWSQQLKSGEVAGPFWALVTHPHADEALLTRAYGEIHMLSHLQGASNRADRQRLRQQVAEIDALNGRLERLRRNHQSQLEQRDRRLEQQSLELRSLKSRIEGSAHRNGKVASHDSEQAQDPHLRRLSRAEERLARREMELDRLHIEKSALQELLKESQQERVALEEAIGQLLAPQSRGGKSGESSLDLGGRRVLYVGGRSTLTPHLRSLVESSNGRFTYHDGGLEQSRAGLHCSLAGADLVFCPVDCVSHDACRRVKRHCRQQAKLFVPLRSSGLSAFAAGLRHSLQSQITEPTPELQSRSLRDTSNRGPYEV